MESAAVVVSGYALSVGETLCLGCPFVSTALYMVSRFWVYDVDHLSAGWGRPGGGAMEVWGAFSCRELGCWCGGHIRVD